MSKMLKYAFVFFILFATAYTGEVNETVNGTERFIATTTVTTVYSVTTTHAVTSVTRTCASTSNVTGTCRRRRGIEELPLILAVEDLIDADEIFPSQPAHVEPTAVAELPEDIARSARAFPSPAEIEASKEIVTSDEVFGKNPKFFKLTKTIISKPSVSKPSFSKNFFKPFSKFLVTLVYTSTSLLTSTSLFSVTVSTKTYVVIGCTPPGFFSSLC